MIINRREYIDKLLAKRWNVKVKRIPFFITLQ